ncbi:MAG: peptide chain release factor N(5)-glutamine methyltransferase [Actinomycetota bacterium]
MSSLTNQTVIAEPPAPLTVGAAIKAATRRLSAAGCDSAGLDAELLLAAAISCDRTSLHIAPEREIAADVQAAFEALCARREAREPVAYILGRRGFRHIELTVDRRVLIPRPETEFLVEAALGLASGSRVVDVGTGSGAVALALKDERRDLALTAIDISAAALAVARANAERLELEVTFHQANLLAGCSGRFDAVVANLPYIAVLEGTQQGHALAPEIVEYEPEAALYAGADGLDLIRRLLKQLDHQVSFVALEVGEGQAPEVGRLMRAVSFAEIETISDLAGIERIVVGRRG